MFQVKVRIEWTCDAENIAKSVDVSIDACNSAGYLESYGVPNDIAQDIVHIHQSRIPFKSCRFQCLGWTVSVSIVI